MKLRIIAQKCGLHQGRKCSGEVWFQHIFISCWNKEQTSNVMGKHSLKVSKDRLLWRADLRCDWHRVPTMLLCHAASRLPVHQKAPRLRPVYVYRLEIQVENHCWLEPPFVTAQQLHSHEAATRVAAIQALKAWKVAKFHPHQWLEDQLPNSTSPGCGCDPEPCHCFVW